MQQNMAPRTVRVLLVAAGTLFAQSYQGEISGVVLDATGAIVPEVHIALNETQTGSRRTAISDSQGRFYLLQIPPGSYRLAVQHPGFRPWERLLTIEVGTRAVIDVQLEVGQVSANVQVESAPPLIEAASGAIGTVVDNSRINTLPLNGRNAFELVALSPGVVPTGSFGLAEPNEKRAQASFSAGGSRGLSNDLMLDGAAITGGSEFNMPLYSPPLEAIQEFRVQLNAYSAEFGRTQGAVVNSVTRSGTNQLHGSIYDYLRNDNLDANSFFNNAAGRPKADLRWNQFGGTLGGPIIVPRLYNGRNRSFVFLSYEGMRYARCVSDLRRVPTPAELGGDFSQTVDAQNLLIPVYDPYSTRPDAARPGRFVRSPYPENRIPSSAINAVAARAGRFYPSPNQQELFPGGPNYFFNGNLNFGSDKGIARIDHNFSEWHRTSGRISGMEDLVAQPLIYGNIASPLPGPQRQWSYTGLLEHTWIVRPNLVFNGKLSFTRFGSDLLANSFGFRFADELGMPRTLQDRADLLTFPAFLVGSSPLGAIGPSAVRNRTTNWNPLASLTWVRGAHNIKFGFDYRSSGWSQFLPSAPSGSYTFAAGSTGGPDPDAVGRSGSAVASFLLGTPSGAHSASHPRSRFTRATPLYMCRTTGD